MDLATNMIPPSVLRRLAVGVLMIATIVMSGCAQVRSFTAKEWPSLGNKDKAALREEQTPGRASRGDLYAKSVGKGEDVSDTEIVASQRRNRAGLVADSRNRPEIERVSAGQANIDLPRRSRRGAPAVTLLAPEALPPLPEPEQLVSRIKDADAVEHPADKSWTGTSKPEPKDDAPAVMEPLVANGSDAASNVTEATSNVPEAAATPSLEQVLEESRKTLNAVSTYQVKMNHQERVNGILRPAEDATLSIRREPFAVRLEWADGPSKGREVLYLSDEKGGMMHVHMPSALVPTLTMSPNSPLATKSSRHSITEAGLDTIVAKMEDALRAQGSGDASFGKITYEGKETPQGIGREAHKILRVTPTGERWVVDIDTETKLPCMVQANAANGDLLERYVYLDPKLELPALSEATAFNPDARWGAPKGLLSRLARGAANQNATETR